MWFHHVLHWFNQEYWSVSWPNVFAPSFWTLMGILIADARNNRRTQRLKDHHIEKVNGLAGQIDALTDRVREMIGVGDDEHE